MSLREYIQLCFKKDLFLSEWEYEFLLEINQLVDSGALVSFKQVNKVKSIYERLYEG